MDFRNGPVPPSAPSRRPVYSSPGDRLPVQDFPDKGYPAELAPLGEWRQETATRHGMRLQSGARGSASEYWPSQYSRMGGPRVSPHMLREMRSGRVSGVTDETLDWSLKQQTSGMPHYQRGVEWEGGQYGSPYSWETHSGRSGYPSSRDMVYSHYDAADPAAMRMQTVPVGHLRGWTEESCGGWPSHVPRDHRARTERPAWDEYEEQTPPSNARRRVSQDAVRRSECRRIDATSQPGGWRDSEAARYRKERGTGARSEVYFPMSGMREQDFDVASVASRSEIDFQYSQRGEFWRPSAHDMGRHAAVPSTREAADARDAQVLVVAKRGTTVAFPEENGQTWLESSGPLH